MPCLKQKMLAVEYLLYVTATDFPGSTFIALPVNLLLFYRELILSFSFDSIQYKVL